MSTVLGDIFYKLEILTIEAYIVENNCYRASKVIKVDGDPSFYTLYALNSSAPYGNYEPDKLEQRGYSKNFHNIPQIVRIYEPQSSVLCCIPAIANNPVRSRIGFIIGELSATALSSFSEKPVHIGSKSIHNVDLSAVDSFSNKINQDSVTDYYKGNLQNDSIPGDYVVRGDYTMLSMDNYNTIIGTDTVNTTYSEVTGELVEKTRIKQTQDILSQSRTFLLDHQALSINKYSLNPYSSYFNCYNVVAGELVRDPSIEPHYDLVCAQGDAVYGYYKTLYQLSEEGEEDKRTNQLVFQETLKPDGKYILNSAKSLCIGKGLNFTHIDCNGPTFQGKKSNLQHFQATTSPLTQATVPVDKAFADDVVDTPTTTDNIKNKLTTLLSYLDFEDDGSIKLRDAWGSYIYLHKGNIQIHAVNNLFNVTGRDAIHISGGVISHCATQDIQLSSMNKAISLYAKNNIECKATQFAADTSNIQLEATSNIICNSAITYVNPNGGTIKLGNPSTMVDIRALNFNVLTQNTISIGAMPYALLIERSKGISLHGNVTVSGNITISDAQRTLQINDKESYTLSSMAGSIFVTQGGLYVNSLIGTATGIIAPYMMAENIASKTGVVGAVKNLNTQVIKTILGKRRIKENTSITINVPVTTTINKFIFNPNISSKACTYKADLCELSGTKAFSTINSYYCYPGQAFWDGSGISVCDANHNTTQHGFKAYGFNKPNIIE